jgi:hypothetical protein
MPRSSPVKTIATLMLCLFLPVEAALAKPAPDPLAPARAKLDALKSSLKASDALATLRKGLPVVPNRPVRRDDVAAWR